MERRHGSLFKGLRAASRNRPLQSRGASGARWSMFLSFRGGMRALVEALAIWLGECARLRTAVTGLARPGGGGWRVEMADGVEFDADAVVVATPAYDAAQLLRPHDSGLARLLGEIRYSSAASVNLAYRAADLPRRPESFSFVVPVKKRRKIIACTFSKRKIPPSRAGGRRADARVHGRRPASRNDGAGRRRDGRRGARGNRGAVYRGVGVPDCVHSGERAAEAVLNHLRTGT